MNNTKYENLCNDWCHSCTGQLHKSDWTPPRRQSFTREVAASHLVSPSRLQVARQSCILEVSHIHLRDWRRSLMHLPTRQHRRCAFCGLPLTVKQVLWEGTHLRDRLPVNSFSRSLLLIGCLKASTIALLLLLSKEHIFIISCNVCYFNFILAL